MKHLLSLILSLAACAYIFSACTNSTCSQNKTTIPLAGFYDQDRQAISLDSITIYGIGGDIDSAIVAAPGTAISTVYLPMQPGSDITTWVISYKQKALDFPELNDTIALSYTSSPYFDSNECGVVMYYNLTHMTYTTHLVDSVAITDSLFNNVDIERIKIFFRTSSEEESSSSEESSGSVAPSGAVASPNAVVTSNEE